jgi:ankyrin repeat protein
MPPDRNINDQDDYRGCSALHYAAILGHIDCAEVLLKYRASVKLEDNDLMTPLDHGTLVSVIQLLDIICAH